MMLILSTTGATTSNTRRAGGTAQNRPIQPHPRRNPLRVPGGDTASSRLSFISSDGRASLSIWHAVNFRSERRSSSTFHRVHWLALWTRIRGSSQLCGQLLPHAVSQAEADALSRLQRLFGLLPSSSTRPLAPYSALLVLIASTPDLFLILHIRRTSTTLTRRRQDRLTAHLGALRPSCACHLARAVVSAAQGYQRYATEECRCPLGEMCRAGEDQG